jgi:hypothetical protein
MAECAANTDFRFPCVEAKDPGETLPVTLSAFGMCAKFWEPNERFELGEYAWPNIPFGFVLECTRAGWSGAKEPKWKNAAVGEAVEDGSAQFTLRVPDLVNGLQPITLAEAVAPDGITVAGIVISEGTKLLVDYAGGSSGEEYDVVFNLTIAGRIRVARQTVHVTEK